MNLHSERTTEWQGHDSKEVAEMNTPLESQQTYLLAWSAMPKYKLNIITLAKTIFQQQLAALVSASQASIRYNVADLSTSFLLSFGCCYVEFLWVEVRT